MYYKKLNNSGVKILQGNEACALGALASDCKFFAGYPITPSTEVPEFLSSAIFSIGGTYMQMEDELASICAIIGATWGGARSMTATSGPGFSLMQEAIGYAVVTETSIVVLNVQRGGPSTGQPTSPSQQDIMQAKYGSHGDYELITLCPSSVQEAFDFTIMAFNFADKYRVPVIILTDEILGHMREKIIIPENIEIFDDKYIGVCYEYYKPDKNLIPPHIRFFEGHNVLLEGQLHDEKGLRAGHLPEISQIAVQRYCEKIIKNIDDITSIKKYFEDNASIVIIAYGIVVRSALSAVCSLRDEGIEIALLKINTVWPLPEKEIIQFCHKAVKVIVPEMNTGKYSKEIQRLVGIEKVATIPSLGGILHTPQEIKSKVYEVIR